VLVLLTNDDGVQAEGLLALYDRLAAEHEVYVVAPDRERSGSSHAITVFQPLMVHRTHIGGPSSPRGGTEAWAVVGTPADCVKLAVFGLLPRRPDLVISGINRGPNLGSDVFYSGTVSAAIEAVILGLPALAVSLAAFNDLDYRFAGQVSAYLAERLMGEGLPRGTLLNVNVPAIDPTGIAGIRVTRLSGHEWQDTFEERRDPRGHSYFWLTATPLRDTPAPGTDTEAIKNGCVSVTPMHLDLTHHSMLAVLEGWNLKHVEDDDDGKERSE
jgi:5'-nucleotidase